MPNAITPSGLRLAQVETSADLVLPHHGHCRPVLCFLQSGGLEQAGTPGVLRSGGVRLAPAGAAHDLRLLPDTRLTVVECAPTGMAGAHPFWSLTSTAVLLPAAALVQQLARVVAPAAPGGVTFELEDATLRLLAAERRRVTGLEVRPQPAGLANIVHDILREPARPVRLGDLARTAGIHRVQLGRWASEWLGRPLWHMVVSARLELARRYLLGSALPLARIAELSGFCDQSHLTRAFRSRFGAAPGRFRRMLQASKTPRTAAAMLHR